jgi:hypothetical protein
VTRATVTANGRDDHRPHPADVPEARRAEAGGDAGRGRAGAAAAGRQRHDEGAGAGVPVRKMLDTGVYGTIEDLARAKGVNATYVSRILRLTLLAPEIVEAILDGRQPAELQLDNLGVPAGVGEAVHARSHVNRSERCAVECASRLRSGTGPERNWI